MSDLQLPQKVKNFDMTRETAENLLKPYFPSLRQIILGAWADWESLPDEQRSKIDARARANCVNSFIVHNARKFFEDNNGVKVSDRRGLFLVEFFDELNLRFKKLTKDKKTSNVATKQQRNFVLQLELPGMPKVVRITVGYLLDVTQTKIKDIFLVLYHGAEIAWDISILNAKSSVIQMPLPTEQRQKRTVKVRAKASELNKQTKEK